MFLFLCHIMQPSSTEITDQARGLSEDAVGGRVSQRPVILSSTGKFREAGPSDQAVFSFAASLLILLPTKKE